MFNSVFYRYEQQNFHFYHHDQNIRHLQPRGFLTQRKEGIGMSDILKSKGNEEFAAKNYERAAQLYGDAATLDPSNPVLYSNKAMALIKLSRWTECIEACDKGLSCQPDNKTKVKLFFRRGSSYSKLNDFHNAIESYQLALKLDSKNTSVLKSIEELKAQESQFKVS